MKSLFQETRIKSLCMPNRFVRSATWMAMADPDGACTDRLFDCYETLGKGDIGYKILKAVLRNRFTIFLYSLIHPWLGFQIARLVSEFTKGDYEKKSAKASMALRVFAFERLGRGDIDLFITGHTHTPELIKVKGKLFLNTGDWIRHLTYAVIRDGRLRLMKWKTQEEVLPVTVGEIGRRARQ